MVQNQSTPVVLVGGLGTRLRSVVGELPKPLAKVNGRPFLSYLFDQLINSGFTRVIVCSGFNGDMISESFGSHYKNLELIYSREPKKLGTAGALRFMIDKVESKKILVLNGDSYCDINLAEFVESVEENNKTNGIALTMVDDGSRYGQVKVDSENNVIEFSEKKAEARHGLINTGIYLFDKSIIKKLPESEEISLETKVLPELTNGNLYACIYHKSFIDIGIPDSYSEAANFFNNIVAQ